MSSQICNTPFDATDGNADISIIKIFTALDKIIISINSRLMSLSYELSCVPKAELSFCVISQDANLELLPIIHAECE